MKKKKIDYNVFLTSKEKTLYYLKNDLIKVKDYKKIIENYLNDEIIIIELIKKNHHKTNFDLFKKIKCGHKKIIQFIFESLIKTKRLYNFYEYKMIQAFLSNEAFFKHNKIIPFLFNQFNENDSKLLVNEILRTYYYNFIILNNLESFILDLIFKYKNTGYYSNNIFIESIRDEEMIFKYIELKYEKDEADDIFFFQHMYNKLKLEENIDISLYLFLKNKYFELVM